MLFSSAVALGALLASVSAQTYKGFNYGGTHTDNTPIVESQYESQFKAAQGLVGASGFTSARIYTLIQAGTTNTPSEAIQAAINTKTSLLLGLWASAGQANIDNELIALSGAINAHGATFTDLIVGISVGSEDLYRISPTGIENHSGVGAGPDEVANYIGQVKNAIANTAAKGKPVGHVDTWTAWVNGSNAAVIAAADFIGMDAYPYFQNTMANAIGNGYSLFFDAYDQTVNVAAGKPVWVTETGWPVSGATSNQAVPSTQNAQTYWDQVGCNRLFGKINTWWYTLEDALPSTPNPSFGVIVSGSTTPLYDLSCSAASSAVPSKAVAGATSSEAAASAQAGGNAGAAGEASAINSGVATAQTAAPTGAASGPQVSAPAKASSQPAKDMTVYTTLTTCPATTVSGAETKTFMTTSTVTVTSCAGGCPSAPTTLVTKTSVLPAASPVTASSCPASLSGTYEYPHLIVPVSKDKPDTAQGTSYNGTISPSTSSIFNFDIPASDSGKTCSLVFLLPTQDKLTTSAFSLSGSGGFDVAQLKSPATAQTTYKSVPATEKDLGGPSSVTPGNEYVVASGPCAAGQKVGYEVSATGSLDLNYFQDYNPSPIGFYVTVC